MTKSELADLTKKYERRLKLAKTKAYNEGVEEGFRRASKIEHYCKKCGELLED